MHVSLSRPLLFTFTGAAKLSQRMLQVLQANGIGIVDQVYRVGHRVDVHLVHTVERLDAVLHAAGAIGAHVLLECQCHGLLLKLAIPPIGDRPERWSRSHNFNTLYHSNRLMTRWIWPVSAPAMWRISKDFRVFNSTHFIRCCILAVWINRGSVGRAF
jgi:hypothetical protein